MLLYLVINKATSVFTPKKYHDLKEVYAFEFSEQVQFRRQKGTLPRAKFLRVNQRQKKNNQDYYKKKWSKNCQGPNIQKTKQSKK